MSYNFKTKRAAFTLLELVIVMGIIAVLTTLGFFAIQSLLRSSRDTDRVNALGEISTEIENYRRQFLAYPPDEEVNFSAETAVIGDKIVELDGSLKPSGTTSRDGTAYHYEQTSGGYALCVLTESGAVRNAGNEDCPADAL